MTKGTFILINYTTKLGTLEIKNNTALNYNDR